MATVRVFNHHVHTSFYWLVLADMLLFILSVYAGTYIYCMIEAEQASFYTYLPLIPGRAMTFSVATAVSLFAMGLYEPRMREGRAGVLVRSLGGFLVSSVIVFSVFIFLPDAEMWEEVLLYTVSVAFIAILVGCSPWKLARGRAGDGLDAARGLKGIRRGRREDETNDLACRLRSHCLCDLACDGHSEACGALGIEAANPVSRRGELLVANGTEGRRDLARREHLTGVQ